MAQGHDLHGPTVLRKGPFAKKDFEWCEQRPVDHTTLRRPSKQGYLPWGISTHSILDVKPVSRKMSWNARITLRLLLINQIS